MENFRQRIFPNPRLGKKMVLLYLISKEKIVPSINETKYCGKQEIGPK